MSGQRGAIWLGGFQMPPMTFLRPHITSRFWPIANRALLKRSFPFGPFMVLGTLVGLVWGTPVAALMWG